MVLGPVVSNTVVASNLVSKTIGALALFLCICCSGVAAQTNSLRAEISSANSDRLQISFTLFNETKQDVWVLSWNTPLDGGFNGDNFDVRFDSKSGLQRVPYRERHIKRAAPTIEDYIFVGAGNSVSAELDISFGYATEQAGLYSIVFDSQIEYYGLPEGQGVVDLDSILADKQQLALHSNKIAVYQADRLSAIESKLPPEFASCDIGEQAEIDIALTAAESMATTALEALTSTTVAQRPSAERYTTWFGSYLSSRYLSVLSNFRAIQDATANKTLKFSCGSPRCGRSTFAFVYSNNPYDVFLCPGFWNAQVTGTDSRAGTIIHELSHFTILGGTDDHQYGQSSAKQLGVSDPNKAINNADSHEYFAENTPALSMSEGSVPDGTPEPSISNQRLTLGTAVDGNLEAGQWRYFEVESASEISLYNLTADLDLYVGNGARPTSNNFQCRPFFGGTAAETCTVDAGAKTIFGVTGAASGTFSLIANGVTAAEPPGSGEPIDAGEGFQTLTLDSPIFGSLAEGEWAYFRVSGAAEINLYNLSADLDLYLGNGANPTAADFSCRPYLSGTIDERCEIGESGELAFIGVNAFSGAGSFSLIGNSTGSSQTSSGQTLTLNSAITGTVEEGEWAYYQVTGATQIQLSELSADLDLYVSRTGTPSESNYDCRPYSAGTAAENCSLTAEGVSYIGINGFDGGSFSLLATAARVDSGSESQTLSLGQAVSGSLAVGEWAYYEVEDATEVSLFAITSDLDLYVSLSGQPSETNYTCRPFIPGDNIENCSVSDRGRIFIGVKAFDAGSYSLVATNSSAQNVGEAVVVEVSQQSYVAGDPLALTMTVTGDQNMDTYVALVLPTGDLFTFTPNGAISAPNAVIPYHTNLQVNGEQTHTILNLPLPSGLASGVYKACALLVRVGQSIAEENWLGLNCTNFMVNPSSGKVALGSKKLSKK
ncbi:MAG: M35 family metallo-endopeptidase [Pseudohongiellaceae bacterium]